MLNAALLDVSTHNTTETNLMPIARSSGTQGRGGTVIRLSSTGHSSQSYGRGLLVWQRQKADQEFDAWAGQLIEATKYKSSSHAIKNHPSFRRIITLGKPAAEKIVSRMESGDVRVQWFPLLKAITGVDPVPFEKRGKINEMAAEWIAWAGGRATVT